MPQALDLDRGGLARRVAGKALLACFQELLRPAVIQALGDTFAATQRGDTFLTTQSFQDDADLLFGGILLARLAADIADRLLGGIFRRHQFLSHLRSPTGLYDEPKILPYAKTSICPKVADVKQN